ncbi:unnamed protein product [Cercospora beticola]|nr:unnamed protein product [Cercospora beticola]
MNSRICKPLCIQYCLEKDCAWSEPWLTTELPGTSRPDSTACYSHRFDLNASKARHRHSVRTRSICLPKEAQIQQLRREEMTDAFRSEHKSTFYKGAGSSVMHSETV